MNARSRHIEGTVILLGEFIGDAIIALPALQAIASGCANETVTLVSDCFVNEMLAATFPHWEFSHRLDEMTGASCGRLIDFHSSGWALEVARQLKCPHKIGVGHSSKAEWPYHVTVLIGPFHAGTSACEFFNPVARGSLLPPPWFHKSRGL